MQTEVGGGLVRIGIDARSLFSPRPRGIGRTLYDFFALLPELRPDWQFVLYHQNPERACALSTPHAEPPWQASNVRTRRFDLRGDRLDAWFQIGLPLHAWRDGLSLLHCPANAAPRFSPTRLVVTIHDLIPLQIEGELNAVETQRFARGVRRAVRSAARIITPSAATRAALTAHFDVPPQRVSVVPWAADTALAARLPLAQRAAVQEALRTRLDVSTPWLLNFSGQSRRKNATGLLQAYARLSADERGTAPLVLTGVEPAPFRAQLRELIATLGIERDCRLLGFVDLDELAALLAGARGVAIPSLCEGFGLPILDAFAAAKPVLAGQASSLPEVGGDAAVYCDAFEIDSITAGLRALLDDAANAIRVERGARRLAEYSWRQTAVGIANAYERALCGARLTRTAEVSPG